MRNARSARPLETFSSFVTSLGFFQFLMSQPRFSKTGSMRSAADRPARKSAPRLSARRKAQRRSCPPPWRRASPPIFTITITPAGRPRSRSAARPCAGGGIPSLARGRAGGPSAPHESISEPGGAGARRTGFAGCASLQPHADTVRIPALLRRSAARSDDPFPGFELTWRKITT